MTGSVLPLRPQTHTTQHSCPMPRRPQRYTNRLWICDCGTGWIARQDYINYASGPVYHWHRWQS